MMPSETHSRNQSSWRAFPSKGMGGVMFVFGGRQPRSGTSLNQRSRLLSHPLFTTLRSLFAKTMTSASVSSMARFQDLFMLYHTLWNGTTSVMSTPIRFSEEKKRLKSAGSELFSMKTIS